MLTAGIEPHVANNIYYASRDVFELFDIQLTEGNKSEALALPAHAVVSESYARKLFGDKAREAINNQAIRISGRRLVDSTVYISGIFKDIPATSHFHTDMLISRPDNLTVFEYVYLLMDKNANIRDLEQKITQIAESDNVRLQALSNNAARIQALLTPLTDIHLHSRTQKEMEHNGNINYVYLVAGANVLLILVVMFNLWHNASLIFSFSRKYYRLLRMARLSRRLSGTKFR